MTVNSDEMRKFFTARSIAIVGVTRAKFAFGGTSFLQKYLEAGYPGRIYPINPKAEEILGRKAYPSLASLPEVPELVHVCVAAPHVPAVLEECGRRGARHVHILSSGFREIGTPEGRELEAQVATIARAYNLLVIGPNCMGPYCPAAKLTAWGAIPGMPGPLGVISQSGSLTQRLTEYACGLGIGTDKAVSIGNGTVLNAVDFLAFMGAEDTIRTVAMYLESITDGERFFAVARAVSQRKPLVIWKGGVSEVGARVAASHTGAMAGQSRVWEAVLRQSGVIGVESLEEWMDAVFALTLLPAPRGRAVFIIGGGGGNGVVCGDTCVREGLSVPPLSPATMTRLRETVPAVGSIAGNPLDDWQTYVDPAYFGRILGLAYDDPAIDMVIVDRLIPRKAFHMPELPDPTAATIAQVKEKGLRKPTVFTIDADGGDPELAQRGAVLKAMFGKGGIPAYGSMERAARALVRLQRYWAWRQRADGSETVSFSI